MGTCCVGNSVSGIQIFSCEGLDMGIDVIYLYNIYIDGITQTHSGNWVPPLNSKDCSGMIPQSNLNSSIVASGQEVGEYLCLLANNKFFPPIYATKNIWRQQNVQASLDQAKLPSWNEVRLSRIQDNAGVRWGKACGDPS